jgi:hypothetical protein
MAKVPSSFLAEEGTAAIIVTTDAGASNAEVLQVTERCVVAQGMAASATAGSASTGQPVATSTDPGEAEPHASDPTGTPTRPPLTGATPRRANPTSPRA